MTNSCLCSNIIRDLCICYWSLVTIHYGTDQLKCSNEIYISGAGRKGSRKTNTPKFRLSHPNDHPLWALTSILYTHKKQTGSFIQFAKCSNFEVVDGRGCTAKHCTCIRFSFNYKKAPFSSHNPFFPDRPVQCNFSLITLIHRGQASSSWCMCGPMVNHLPPASIV
jgi:hypothetical protein